MAMRYMEGFDDGLFMQKGWYRTNFFDPQITTGRFGGSATFIASSCDVQLSFPSPITGTGVLGFALTHTGQALNGYGLVTFGNTRLRTVTGGYLSLRRADNDVEVGVTSSPVWPSPGIWRYIEIKYNSTTGATIVRVDGVNVISATVPTQASITVLQMHSFPNNYSNAYDDMYMLDTTGTRNNDFLGDVRVQTLYPASDGANTGLTPSTGTNHAALVDETTANTTDYVSSAVAGTKDTYHFQSLSANTAGVFAVEVTNYSQKDAVGPASFSNVVRVGSTDYSQTAQALSASWTTQKDLMESNPATSSAWSASDVNNAEFGVEVV